MRYILILHLHLSSPGLLTCSGHGPSLGFTPLISMHPDSPSPPTPECFLSVRLSTYPPCKDGAVTTTDPGAMRLGFEPTLCHLLAV